MTLFYTHIHTRNQVTHLLVVFHAVFLTYTFQLFHTFYLYVSCFLFVCTYLTPLFLPILCTCKRSRTHTLPEYHTGVKVKYTKHTYKTTESSLNHPNFVILKNVLVSWLLYIGKHNHNWERECKFFLFCTIIIFSAIYTDYPTKRYIFFFGRITVSVVQFFSCCLRVGQHEWNWENACVSIEFTYLYVPIYSIQFYYLYLQQTTLHIGTQRNKQRERERSKKTVTSVFLLKWHFYLINFELLIVKWLFHYT